MILPIVNFSNYNILVNTNNKIVQKNKNITFEGCKAPQYKAIKNLHGLTCIRCGGPIIEPQKLIEAYRVISLPLKQIIKKGHLDINQSMPAIWALLNDFAEKYPKDSLDKILENEDNHTLFRTTIEQTIVPNLDRNNRELYNKHVTKFNAVESGIRKSARTELRSSSVVMKRLKSFLPILKEIEKKEPFKAEIRGKIGAFEEFLYYSSIYPDKTLSEIVNLPEVKSYVEKMIAGTQEEFNHSHTIKFNEIRDIIKRTLKCSDDEINKLQHKLMTTLFNNNKDPGIRLYNTLQICKEFTQENNCDNIYFKIQDIIKAIPEPPYNKYVELSNGFDKKNDFMIVDSLLKQYIGTSEHYEARSTGGKDSRENKISMHLGCNRKRSNMNYKNYSEIYPYIPYYTEKQIEEVSNYILAGKMTPKYDLYPPLMANTIKSSTDGAINIDVTAFCKKAIKKAEKNVLKIREQLTTLATGRDREFAKLNSAANEEEKETIRDEINNINKQYQSLLEEHKEQRRLIGWYNKYLRDNKI